MAGKRGRGRPPVRRASELEVVVLDSPGSDATVSEERQSLRQRWELASVLNFLHVFKELVAVELKISAEEIETALITPNNDLAAVHVSLLKGIPPVNRNMMESDGWVAVVCKKLSTWWSWVSEGENPLKSDHGEEIARYKEFDPVTRLLILKALCEVRALQDDILRYITDALKNGTPLTAFRKERIGGDDNGVTYWYEGDPVIGCRLYREIPTVMKQKMKGKGCSSQSIADSQWETLATNLEEFQETSDNLASSTVMADKAVGEIITRDILPVLKELQKKKERAVKRQQRQALLLNSFLNSNRDLARQSRRERKPVKYTFDDFDKTIEEAIQVSKKSKTSGSINGKKENSSQDEVDENFPEVGHKKYQGQAVSDDEDDDDEYDEKGDDENSSAYEEESADTGNSDKENVMSKQNHRGTAQHQKDIKTKIVRTSGRTTRSTNKSNSYAYHAEAKGHAEMKKRLKQRPTRNSGYNVHVPSDTEDESSSETNEEAEMAQDSEQVISTSATASDEPQDSGDDDDGGDDSADDGDDDGGDDRADGGDDSADDGGDDRADGGDDSDDDGGDDRADGGDDSADDGGDDRADGGDDSVDDGGDDSAADE